VWAPRLAWLVAAGVALLVAVAYDPLLDASCPLTCAPLPGPVRGQVDQAALARIVAIASTVAVALHLPRQPARARPDLIVGLTAVLVLVPLWSRVLGGSTAGGFRAVAAALALLTVAVSTVGLVRRRARARAVVSSLNRPPDLSALTPEVAEVLTPAERLALSNAVLERELRAAAHALDGSRSALARALELERARITADLHDLAQQRIVGVLLHTRAFASRPGCPADRRAELLEVAELLTAVLDAIRGLASQRQAHAVPEPGDARLIHDGRR
jgi:signal transduction histidine kinase